MNYLIEKVSSYNIFNYLLPGVLFATLAQELTSFDFMHPNWLLGLFLYYFIGLCVSRVGSLVLEPALKRIGFLRFADYEDFVEASRSDSKIELLSEQNNMYRTLCSLCVLLILFKLYDAGRHIVPLNDTASLVTLLLGLLALFSLSYRKATQYVVHRVRIALPDEEGD